MEERAVTGVRWTLLSYIGTRGVGVLTTLTLARLLAPRDFGLMALATTATSLLYWVGDLGFSNTLILRQDLDRRGQGTLFTLMMGSSALAAAIGVGLSPVAAAAFDEPRLTALLASLSAVLVVGGVAGYYDGLLQRELEFRRRFAGFVVLSVTNAVVSVGLAIAGAGVWSLVVGQLASYVCFALTLVTLAPYRVAPRFDLRLVRGLVRNGGGFVVQGVTAFVRHNTDNVVVARSFGAAQLGFYSMGFRLADLSYWAIAGPVGHVTFAGLSRSRNRGEDVRPAFLSILRLVALIGIPFGILLSAAAEPLTRTVFGDRWLPMIGPLAVLGIWAALRPLESTMSWVLSSIGRVGAVAWLSIGILIPLVPAFIVATHIGRLAAVAAVILANTAVSLAITILLARRYLEVTLRAMWASLRPIVLAAPAMWLATRFVGELAGNQHAVVGLVAACAAGLAVYAAVISLQDRRLLPAAGVQIRRTLGRSAQEPEAADVPQTPGAASPRASL